MAIKEMYYTALHAMHASKNLTTIILGLDFLMFNAFKDFVKVDNTQFSPDRMILDNSKNCFHVFMREFPILFGNIAFKESIRTLMGPPRIIEYLKVGGQMALVNGKEKGVIPNKNQTPHRVSRGYINHSWRVKPHYRYCMQAYDGQSRMSYFKRLIQEAYDRNVNVVVFFSPVHSSLYVALFEAGLLPQFEMWKRQIVTMLFDQSGKYGRKDPLIFDYAYINPTVDYKSTTLDGGKLKKTLFLDDAHYGEYIGNKIQQDFLRGHISSENFGIKLSPQIIDDILLNQRRQIYIWRQNNPKATDAIKSYAHKSYKKTLTLGCSSVADTLIQAESLAKKNGSRKALEFLTKEIDNFDLLNDFPILSKNKDGVPVGSSHPVLDLMLAKIFYAEQTKDLKLTESVIEKSLKIAPDAHCIMAQARKAQ
ncbi:MAG: hypothetical protein AAF228_13060 [Pseudomonadota bacterium]